MGLRALPHGDQAERHTSPSTKERVDGPSRSQTRSDNYGDLHGRVHGPRGLRALSWQGLDGLHDLLGFGPPGLPVLRGDGQVDPAARYRRPRRGGLRALSWQGLDGLHDLLGFGPPALPVLRGNGQVNPAAVVNNPGRPGTRIT
jgi:hypothetical protein